MPTKVNHKVFRLRPRHLLQISTLQLQVSTSSLKEAAFSLQFLKHNPQCSSSSSSSHPHTFPSNSRTSTRGPTTKRTTVCSSNSRDCSNIKVDFNLRTITTWPLSRATCPLPNKCSRTCLTTSSSLSRLSSTCRSRILTSNSSRFLPTSSRICPRSCPSNRLTNLRSRISNHNSLSSSLTKHRWAMAVSCRQASQWL